MSKYLVLHYPKKPKDDMVFYWSDDLIDVQKYANENDKTFIFKSIKKEKVNDFMVFSWIDLVGFSRGSAAVVCVIRTTHTPPHTSQF